MWFAPDWQVDARLAQHFSRELSSLHLRPAREFLSDPLTALAGVLLFDQLPRNLHRGTARAFATDALARAILHGALARGWDKQLLPQQRQFLAMPLMHSERIADQRRSLAYFTRLGARYGAPFARAHFRMIARFGRFPHRNAVLGRRSTAAELEALGAGYRW
jgi:uncharacterized protein (DUF924 family)